MLILLFYLYFSLLCFYELVVENSSSRINKHKWLEPIAHINSFLGRHLYADLLQYQRKQVVGWPHCLSSKNLKGRWSPIIPLQNIVAQLLNGSIRHVLRRLTGDSPLSHRFFGQNPVIWCSQLINHRVIIPRMMENFLRQPLVGS